MTENSEKQKSGSRIPSANNPGALSVTDGTIAVGTVVPSGDGSFFSFGVDEILIGEYRTLPEAARSLPRVRA